MPHSVKIQIYRSVIFSGGFIRVRSLLSHFKRRTQAERYRQDGAKEHLGLGGRK